MAAPTGTETDHEAARLRWEERADGPLTVAAVLFLAAYAWPILEPGLDDRWLVTCRVVTFVVWLLFLLDYVVRVWLAGDRRGFVRRHVLDLVVVVLPVFRPLQALRLVTVLNVLNVLNRHAGASLRGQVAVYVVAASGIVVLVAALAVLDAERRGAGDGANIATFGEAVWWATTTVATVGYGDYFPVSTTGRFVAAGLMVAGIALLGIVTASLASWLIQRVAQLDEDSETATRRDIAALTREVAALRAELRERDAGRTRGVAQ